MDAMNVDREFIARKLDRRARQCRRNGAQEVIAAMQASNPAEASWRRHRAEGLELAATEIEAVAAEVRRTRKRDTRSDEGR